MFKNLSLKVKLMTICTVLSLFTAITGGIAYLGLKNITHKYSHIATINMPRALALSSMQGNFRRVRGHQNLLLAQGLTESELKSTTSDIERYREDFNKDNKAFSQMPFAEGEKPLYDEVNTLWNSFDDLIEKSVVLSRSKIPSDRENLSRIVLKESTEIGKRLNESIQKLIKTQMSQSEKLVTDAEESSRMAQLIILLVIISGFALAQIVGIIFSRSLSAQLQKLADRLGKGADQVAQSAHGVSEAGTELSSGATEQAAALQETVASLDEVSAMVNKNADNAKNSQDLSATSHKSAVRGKEVVGEMIRSIDEINQSNTEIMQQIENSNHEISEIVKVISEIGSKTKVINDIVFQTKLLSFNASVEAARAGEHGKGFAVVAEEVGNLAQMSGNASKEISSMLDNSIQKVESIVNQTKSRVEKLITTGKEKVSHGTSTARRCGEVLDEIVANVSKVSEMVGEIATASNEQAHGVQEISKAMGQLDQVTQRSANASRQSAEAVEVLAAESEDLRKLVQSLILTVHGAKMNQNSQLDSSSSHPDLTGEPDNIVSIERGSSKKQTLAG